MFNNKANSRSQGRSQDKKRMQKPLRKKSAKTASAVRKNALPRKSMLNRYSLRLAFVLLLVLSGFGLKELFLSVELFPIKQIKVEGEFVYLDKVAIKQSISGHSVGSFFVLDIESLRGELLKMQWVDDAFVRREWPSTVVIRIVEKQPVARWNDRAVLTATGQLFFPPQLNEMQGLVKLSGPEDRHGYVLTEFNKMQSLLYQADVQIERLVQNERRSWKMQVAGVEINLGRKDIYKKIERLAVIYQSLLRPKIDKIKQIDLRYTNGFAVQWASDSQTTLNANDKMKKIEMLLKPYQRLLMGAVQYV